jgi:transketolase
MSDNATIAKLRALADQMRLKALEMAYRTGPLGAHLGPGLSAIEIHACLFGDVMKLGKDGTQGDLFLPSKAHCVLAYYTALAYTGFFPIEDLDGFEVSGSELPGHPVKNEKRGITFSGGSLGMAPAQGIGVALAWRRKNIDRNVFVLVGDGECNEGSCWEAFMSAAHYKLDNLVIIVDENKLQYDGTTDQIMSLGNLTAKFQSFGFDCAYVDGHDVGKLHPVLAAAARSRNGKPQAVIADTIKGKGVSFMEGRKEWHHSRLTKEQYDLAVAELAGRRS